MALKNLKWCLLNHCGQWQAHLRARPHEHGLSRSKHLLILSLYNSVILFLKACFDSHWVELPSIWCPSSLDSRQYPLQLYRALKRGSLTIYYVWVNKRGGCYPLLISPGTCLEIELSVIKKASNLQCKTKTGTNSPSPQIRRHLL